MPTGAAGKIFLDKLNGGPSQYSIVVRTSDPFVRKRFTVAHEVAHFVLHRGLIGLGITDDALYRSGLTTTQEAEANVLAADILMPDHLIIQAITDKVDPEYLARVFQVSTQAMKIKLGI